MMQWVDYSDGAHSLQKVHSRSLRGTAQRKNITPLPSSASRHSGVFGFGYVTASGRALFFFSLSLSLPYLFLQGSCSSNSLSLTYDPYTQWLLDFLLRAFRLSA